MVDIFHRKGARGKETQRIVRTNDPESNNLHNYNNNFIKTYKYTPITFIPVNLMEQFMRLANFYFLVLLILQLTPISTLSAFTTVAPLVVVLMITLLKDGYEDWCRRKNDRAVNHRLTRVIRANTDDLVETQWQKVVVGDILHISKNDPITADLVLLSCSDESNICFVETAELDGETNLKVRSPLRCTSNFKNPSGLATLKLTLHADPPNNNLNRFLGRVELNGEEHPVDNLNVALRGCVLRNTQEAYGLVVYAGADSKLMKNSGTKPLKRTKTDVTLNYQIIWILLFLLLTCAVMSLCALYMNYNYFANYPYIIFPTALNLNAAEQFLGYLILLNTVVPISLYVSIEFFRLMNSFWIDFDVQMYDRETDTPAKASSTTLNEELGQIQYIFSDKTGTLTENKMIFKECSIKGVRYGAFLDHRGDAITSKEAIHRNKMKMDETFPPWGEKHFLWTDKALAKRVLDGDSDTCDFFRILAVCHTVMVEFEKEEGVENASSKLIYQAQSPDEAALVSAARNFGYVFKARDQNFVLVELSPQLRSQPNNNLSSMSPNLSRDAFIMNHSTHSSSECYKLLAMLDFDNVRKRMSVLVQKYDSPIELWTKGADTLVLGLLAPGQEDLVAQTENHLQEFATQGLRTLVVAKRIISDEECIAWMAKFNQASMVLGDREGAMQECYELIEKDLTLIGATAVEDKLQAGVPDTIAGLKSCGIKLWVLTGDKIETAINIGYACHLINASMQEIVINVDDEAEVQRLLQQAENLMLSSAIDVADAYNLHAPHENNNSTQSIGASNVRPAFAAGLTQRNGTKTLQVIREDQSLSVGNTLEMGNLNGADGYTNKALNDDFDGYSLVISGTALRHALTKQNQRLFLRVATRCKTVVCCRVTPLQKAQTVELVKENLKCITLAIGDGANDVSMIQAAHIGVGISGQEGMQAVLASDYSFGKFKFLNRLLLVHGRWAYLRMSTFLAYFFYKNFAFTLTHVCYAIFSGYSGQRSVSTLFIMIYNLCYTSWPVLTISFHNQDVNDKVSELLPNLYHPGLKDVYLNSFTFAFACLEGISTACVTFFLSWYYVKYARYQDEAFFLLVMETLLASIVTVRCAMDTMYWTGFNFFVIFGSIGFFFLFVSVGYDLLFEMGFSTDGLFGDAIRVWSEPTFWFILVLQIVICIFPVMLYRMSKTIVKPSLSYRARMRLRAEPDAFTFGSGLATKLSHRLRPTSSRRKQSGYAWAHETGYAGLIMSGKLRQSKRAQADIKEFMKERQRSKTTFNKLTNAIQKTSNWFPRLKTKSTSAINTTSVAAAMASTSGGSPRSSHRGLRNQGYSNPSLRASPRNLSSSSPFSERTVGVAPKLCVNSQSYDSLHGPLSPGRSSILSVDVSVDVSDMPEGIDTPVATTKGIGPSPFTDYPVTPEKLATVVDTRVEEEDYREEGDTVSPAVNPVDDIAITIENNGDITEEVVVTI